MDVAIMEAIATVGFPIFSFLLCGKGLKYVYDKERASLDSAIDKLTALTEAVNRNSETLHRLADKIGDKEDKHED